MNKLPPLFIDLDDVTASLIPKWLELYNQKYNDSLTRDKITFWDWHRLTKPECGEKLYQLLNIPGLFENLDLIDGATKGIQYAKNLGYDVCFLSASTSKTSSSEKQAWLRKHFGQWGVDNCIITKRKDLLSATNGILIDDGAHNIRDWTGRAAIVVSAPHNQEVKEGFKFNPLGAYNPSTLVRRAKDWNEIMRELLSLKEWLLKDDGEWKEYDDN